MDPVGVQITPIFNLLILMVLVSLITQRFRMPYTVALVFAAIFSSMISPHSLPQFSKETFLSILLPPVIFQAAIRYDISEIRRNGSIIFSLTFIGTLLSALLIGFFINFILNIPLLEAFLLGVIISPTDPTAVISTLRKFSVPRRLSLIIEGESLFNDGIAVVAYSALILSFKTGSFDITIFFRDVISSIIVGMVIGIIIGYIISRAIIMTQENFVKILLTFIGMYSSYQISEYFGGNGIISVAVTGIIIGTLIRKSIPSRSMEDIDMIWAFFAFIFTSVAFILIGLDIDLLVLDKYLYAIALSILIVLAVRILTVYSVSTPFNWKKEVIPRKWQNMIVWSGLRGAVSVMLALGLGSLGVQYASELTAIIFGVVFFSILFQGILFGVVADRLGFHHQSLRAG